MQSYREPSFSLRRGTTANRTMLNRLSLYTEALMQTVRTMWNCLSLYTEALQQTVRTVFLFTLRRYSKQTEPCGTVFLFTLRHYSKQTEPCGTVFLFTLRHYSKQTEPCGTFPSTIRCTTYTVSHLDPSLSYTEAKHSQNHLRNYSKLSQDHLELSLFYNKVLHLYMLQYNCIPHKRDFLFVGTNMYLVCSD